MYAERTLVSIEGNTGCVTPTNLVKQVSAGSELQQHVNARNVLMFGLQLDNRSINEFEHVAMFQRRMHSHFLFNCLSILCGRFMR